MLTDIYFLMIIALGIVGLMSLFSIFAALFAFWSGALQRYKQQRDENLQHFYKTKEEIEKRRKKRHDS